MSDAETQPLPTRPVRKAIWLALGLALSLSVVVPVEIAMFQDLGLVTAFVLPGLLGLAMATSLSGSLIMGAVLGYRFHFAAVGPLMVARTPQGRLRLMRSTAGWCPKLLVLPVDERRPRLRQVLFRLGGPLGLLLLSPTGLALSVYGHFPVARWLGVVAGAWLLLSLLPLSEQAEGTKLLLLLRGGPRALSFCERLLGPAAYDLLGAAEAAGQRPRTWQGALIARASAWAPVYGSLWGYFWALDRGEVGHAGAYLDRALRLLASGMAVEPRVRKAVRVEAAFFLARYRRDADTARAHLQGSRLELAEPWHQLRAEAAILLTEGHHPAARLRAEEALAAPGQRPERGTTAAEGDWLREIIAACTGIEHGC